MIVLMFENNNFWRKLAQSKNVSDNDYSTKDDEKILFHPMYMFEKLKLKLKKLHLEQRIKSNDNKDI